MDQLLCNPWFSGMAGAAVGIGILIIILAKWGSSIFRKINGENGGSIKTIWRKIDEMFRRQNELRDKLPDEYVRIDYLKILEAGQVRIETKLDKFINNCLTGKCALGRQGTNPVSGGERL